MESPFKNDPQNLMNKKQTKTKDWKENHKDYTRVYNKEYRSSTRDWLRGLKKECAWCKSTIDLQFHHVDPSSKVFKISRLSVSNKEKLRKEISKCIVLCKSCHNSIGESTKASFPNYIKVHEFIDRIAKIG